MKTAIQIIIDELTEAKDAALNEAELARLNYQDSSGADALFIAYSIAIRAADKQLITEKQQLCDFYIKGRNDNHLDFYPEKHAKEEYDLIFNKK